MSINILHNSIGKHNKVNRYSTVQYYYPKVKYSYEVNGKQYKNDKIALDNPRTWRQEKKDAYDLLKNIIKKRTAYINEKRPSASFILAELTRKRKQHFLAIIISGLLLIIASVVLMAEVFI